MSVGKKFNATLHQCMLRIRDPAVSLPFYERCFGMKLVHRLDSPKDGVSHYHLERPRLGQALPASIPSAESESYLSNSSACGLELMHIHGTEADPKFKGYWSGNQGSDVAKSSPLYMKDGPVRGFGHIAFNVDDVYAFCAWLEGLGVPFQKRPNEGRMKGLAFALDPDGYWIEIVQREAGRFVEPCNLSQVMLRVKDGAQSVRFYSELMGMSLTTEFTIPGDFTNYFLMSLKGAEQQCASGAQRSRLPFRLWQPALELTHNHGTERDAGFQVHNGNGDPQGFGHITFLVDDVAAMSKELEARGVSFFKRPEECGPGMAVILDPSGYRVVLVQRSSIAAPDGAASIEAKLEA